VNIHYYTHKIKFVNTFFDFILYNIFVPDFVRLYRKKYGMRILEMHIPEPI
jgi:hypothetical protein